MRTIRFLNPSIMTVSLFFVLFGCFLCPYASAFAPAYPFVSFGIDAPKQSDRSMESKLYWWTPRNSRNVQQEQEESQQPIAPLWLANKTTEPEPPASKPPLHLLRSKFYKNKPANSDKKEQPERKQNAHSSWKSLWKGWKEKPASAQSRSNNHPTKDQVINESSSNPFFFTAKKPTPTSNTKNGITNEESNWDWLVSGNIQRNVTAEELQGVAATTALVALVYGDFGPTESLWLASAVVGFSLTQGFAPALVRAIGYLAYESTTSVLDFLQEIRADVWAKQTSKQRARKQERAMRALLKAQLEMKQRRTGEQQDESEWLRNEQESIEELINKVETKAKRIIQQKTKNGKQTTPTLDMEEEKRVKELFSNIFRRSDEELAAFRAQQQEKDVQFVVNADSLQNDTASTKKKERRRFFGLGRRTTSHEKVSETKKELKHDKAVTISKNEPHLLDDSELLTSLQRTTAVPVKTAEQQRMQEIAHREERISEFAAEQGDTREGLEKASGFRRLFRRRRRGGNAETKAAEANGAAKKKRGGVLRRFTGFLAHSTPKEVVEEKEEVVLK